MAPAKAGARSGTDRRWASPLFFGSREARDGRHTLGLDAGLIYLLSRRVALDAGVETSLNGQGPDIAFRAGLTVRLGR